MSTLFKSVLGAFAAVFATITAFAADATLPNGATEVAISTTAASVSHKGEMIAVKADESYSNQAPAYVAKIGEQGYNTIYEAVAAAKSGDTIVLQSDIELTEDAAYALNITSKAVNIDGNGHKITQSADCDIIWAVFYFHESGAPVTIKNLTFDGIRGGAAVWAFYTDVNIVDCVFQNGEYTQIQGVVRTTGCDASVKNSKFLNNECNMAVSFNFDIESSVVSSDLLTVEGCEFSGNTCADTAVIYYVKGNGCTIKDNTFAGNTVDTASHGAVVYYSEGANSTVTGNQFSGNTIKAASARAGILVLEAGVNVSENAFVGNTISSTASGTTYVATVVNKADADSSGATVSGNYWGGGKPNYVSAKGAPTVSTSYYTTYDAETGKLDGLVAISTCVAKIGDVEYFSLQAAVNAAKDGDTVIVMEGRHNVFCPVGSADNYTGRAHNLFIGKNITVKGEEGKDVVLYSYQETYVSTFDARITVLISGSDGVVLDNLIILPAYYPAGITTDLPTASGSIVSAAVGQETLKFYYNQIIDTMRNYNGSGAVSENYIANLTVQNCVIGDEAIPAEEWGSAIYFPGAVGSANNFVGLTGGYTIKDNVLFGGICLCEGAAKNATSAECIIKDNTIYGGLFLNGCRPTGWNYNSLTVFPSVNGNTFMQTAGNTDGNAWYLASRDGDQDSLIPAETLEAYLTGNTFIVEEGKQVSILTGRYAYSETATEYYAMIAEVEPTFVAKIGEQGYATLEEALNTAKAGDEIVLLDNVTLSAELTLPAGIKFNGNGKQINGSIVAAGNLEFVGLTKVTSFNAGYNKPTITIGAGACLEMNGTGRMVIGHGATFNITGTVADAKTADKSMLTPSLVMPGASFTGAGVTFNVNNAYIKTTASYCSSSKSASGTFDFNINNSIWEQFGKLAFEAQSTAATVNFELKDSVLTTTSHLVFGVAAGEVVIDNSNVNVGTSRQLENRSTMTIKNGSVVNGAVATSSNAINPGTIIVENATYAVTGQFSGSTVGTGTLVIKNGANVSVGSIVDNANIQIDATGMSAGDEINLTANLSKYAGTLSVINNDTLEASIAEGKIVLSAKPVAEINGVKYSTLEEAIAAAQAGDTVTLLTDVALLKSILLPAEKALTIDGNGHKLTAADDFTSDGNSAAMVLAYGDRGYSQNSKYEVKNLTFEGFNGLSRVLRANFCDAVVENCTFKNNEVVGGVVTSADAALTVSGCTFNGNTVSGEAGYGVIDIGSDVGNGTTLKAVIENNKFVGNKVEYAVLFLFTSADVSGNYFNGNEHTGINGNAAAILAGPYTGNMEYAINVTDNAFDSAISKGGVALPAVFAEDWSSLGATTKFDLSSNYWNGGKPDYETSGANPLVTVEDYYTTYDAETGKLGGLVAIPTYIAKIGEQGYATLEEALNAAKAGDEIVLLDNVTLSAELTLPAGIKFNGNGKTINGSIKAGGNLTFVGATTIATFSAGWYNNTITIGEGASLKVTGGRVTVSYGNIFNIIGSIENAKVADKTSLTPSLEIVSGLSFNGNGGGVEFNVLNAYVKLGDSSTKNSGATGEFNLNFDNSIVEFTKTLKTYMPTTSDLSPEFNITAKDSVLSYASHLELWLDTTVVSLDNTDMTVSGSFANAGDVLVDNGSKFSVKAPIMSSHGGNTGTITVDGGSFELADSNQDWENAGDMIVSGDGKLVVNDFKCVNDGGVSIDATGMTVGDSVADRIVLNSANTDFAYTDVQVSGNSMLVVDAEGKLAERTLAGSGTEADPYRIGSAEEMFFFAEKVNAGGYKGTYVVLTADIDLEQEDWISIGTASNPFIGTFDGKGYAISNIWSYERGLFGFTSTGNYVDSGLNGRATIKNLILNGVEVYNQSTSAVGGLVGQAGQNTEVTDVTITGYISIYGYGYVGGVVGQGYVHVNDCHVIGVDDEYGNRSTIDANYWAVGGVVGHAGGESGSAIVDCSVKNVALRSTYYGAGAIAGVGTGGAIENVSAESVSIEASSSPDANGLLVGCNYGKITGNSSAKDVVLTVDGVVVTEPQDMAVSVNGAFFLSLQAALSVAEDGDTVVLLADVSDLAVTVEKSVTIKGNVKLNNVSISGSTGIDLAVEGLTFTGNSWINSGGVNKLVVKNVTANVTVANTAATNSRSAFIALGRSEQAVLDLVVEGCSIQTQSGADAILGWAAVNEVVLKDNVFGSEGNHFTYADAVKFMAFADGAEVIIQGNAVYSDYNGIVFAQNTTRGNAYTVIIDDNSFFGNADHIWIEVSGSKTYHGSINASSSNTVNGKTLVTSDIKPYNLDTFTGYLGVDVALNAEGGIIGGTFVNINEELVADGYDVVKNEDGTYGVVEGSRGTLTNCYTSDSTYWGECGGNAKKSFEIKFFNGETYMGYTSLNNIGGIIDGDVYVSWHIRLDAASNIDEYWTMAWEIQPTIAMQPNRCEQWVDGVKVAECIIEPNWSDKIFPVVAAVTDRKGKILSFVNNLGAATMVNAVANGGYVTLLADVKMDASFTLPAEKALKLDLNGKTLFGNDNAQFLNNGELTLCDSSDEKSGVNKLAIVNVGTLAINSGHYDSSISGEGAFAFTGGTYTQDVKDWCSEGYLCAKQPDTDPAIYKVGKLPNAEVVNMGPTEITDYKVYNGSSLNNGTAPINLQVALDFISNDTEKQAQENAFGQYTTDFYITINGAEGGSFVANGCYLAGNYGAFGWVMIPLDGMTIENGKVYPVISSVGFDFSYEDICTQVKDFKCGIYFSPEVLEANPNLTVSLNLGLSETIEQAQSATFIPAIEKPYSYDVEDMTKAVAIVGSEYFTTFAEAVAAAMEFGYENVKVVDNTSISGEIAINKNLILDLNGKTLTVADGASIKVENAAVKIAGGILAGIEVADIALDNATLTLPEKVDGDFGSLYTAENEDGSFSIATKFQSYIQVVDGVPCIGFLKDVNNEYKLMGKADLTDAGWTEIDAGAAAEAKADPFIPLYWAKPEGAYRFFWVDCQEK